VYFADAQRVGKDKFIMARPMARRRSARQHAARVIGD
jgi:hypothetical protein